MRRFAAAITVVCALLLALAMCPVSGCLGYRLGSTLPANIRSVHVPTFVNRSGEPDIEFAMTSATIQEFRRDGSLQIEVADRADAVLEATLTGFQLKPLRYSDENVTEASEYRLTLTVSIKLKESGTGEVLTDVAGIRGRTTFQTEGDLASAKLGALPDAARDLAHDIVENVVEAW